MRRWGRRRRRQRTSGTYPERLMRRALTALGIPFQENPRVLGMRPDIVMPELRVAVFVDGCFWHGCPRHFKVPEKNPVFWSAKIGRNKARDERQEVKLIAAGWVVVRLWEHEIRSSATRSAARVAEVCAGRVVVTPADQPASARSPRKARPVAMSGKRTPRTAPTSRSTGRAAPRTQASTAAPNDRRKRGAPKPKKTAAAAGTKPKSGSLAAVPTRSGVPTDTARVSPSTNRRRSGAGSGRG